MKQLPISSTKLVWMLLIHVCSVVLFPEGLIYGNPDSSCGIEATNMCIADIFLSSIIIVLTASTTAKSIKALRLTHFSHANRNLQQQSNCYNCCYTKMNAKLLALMALLSLAALAAGYPTHDQNREDIDALKLLKKIAMEKVFKQSQDHPCELYIIL